MKAERAGSHPHNDPRERGRSLNCNFDSAQLGRTRSSTWFGFPIPELKADRQDAKIKNTVAEDDTQKDSWIQVPW